MTIKKERSENIVTVEKSKMDNKNENQVLPIVKKTSKSSDQKNKTIDTPLNQETSASPCDLKSNNP